MKKIVALLLAAVMALTGVSALAENTKHERVYVVADSHGAVQSLTDTIRLENADGLDEITDRTLLTAIENLSGEETFRLDGESLVWQAKGNDITYQGTSDQTPAVMPTVTITLDGEEVTAAELKDKTGEAVLTVRYTDESKLPALAVSVLPLPAEGVSSLTAENAAVLTEMGRKVLVGWAVPGVDEALNLPAAFTVSFHADHADLKWMMTLTTADPISAALEKADVQVGMDAGEKLNALTALLRAAARGETLPETEGKMGEYAAKLNELNTGLAALDEGAEKLADGASQVSGGAAALKDGSEQLNGGMAQVKDGAGSLAEGMTAAAAGAASLESGLAQLTANNEQLNGGAAQLFAAILNTANSQIAASGLDAAGITVPELTAENYAAVLDGVTAQLDPEALQAAAAAQVEAAVRQQVEANADQVRAAVEKAVRVKVLEAVLAKLQLNLTAQQYEMAVKLGKVSADQAAQISAAVDMQMAGDAAAQVEAAVQEQIEKLVKENTEKALQENADVAAKLNQAAAARESLTALKAQMDQVSAFVTGVQAYTAGAAQAAAGAAQLNAGMAQLQSGADALKDGAVTLSDGAAALASGAAELATGAETLHTGAAALRAEGTQKMRDTLLAAEKDAAAKLLDMAENKLGSALRIYEQTRDSARDCGYDLRPEGMKTVTAFIIRTDLQ